MHFLKIYDPKRTTQLLKLSRYIRLEFEDVLNNFGTGFIELPLTTEGVSAEVFNKFNRVSILDGNTEKWRGFILDYTIKQFTIEVNLASSMKFLKKRVITKTYNSENVVDIFEDIIDEMNAADQTEFTFGGSDITGTSEDLKFVYKEVYEALQDCAKAVAGEVYIDMDDKIYLKSQVGSDQTSNVVFKFLQNKMPENNIKRPDYTESGDDQFNYIIGRNTQATPKVSVKSNVPSGENRIEKYVQFPNYRTQNALDEATQDFLDKHGLTIRNHNIEPLPNKINERLYNIGDLVKMKLKFGFIDFDENFRVVRKKYQVMKDGSIEKTFVELGKNALTKDDFFLRFADIDRRVLDLELNA
jgi:hypothetical protein